MILRALLRFFAAVLTYRRWEGMSLLPFGADGVSGCVCEVCITGGDDMRPTCKKCGQSLVPYNSDLHEADDMSVSCDGGGEA